MAVEVRALPTAVSVRGLFHGGSSCCSCFAIITLGNAVTGGKRGKGSSLRYMGTKMTGLISFVANSFYNCGH